MSHIRYATQGEVSFRNTQPFSRELAGRQHVFMHNGDLENLINNPKYQNNRFKPMGNTDSEMAFCFLMHKMTEIWDKSESPEVSQRYQMFSLFAEEMRNLGLANFIYSDSEYIFVYSHKRVVKDKRNDNQWMTLPGLHVLLRSCNIDLFDTHIKGLEIKKQQAQNVVLISSVPLNDENWVALDVAESMVLKDGEIVTGFV